MQDTVIVDVLGYWETLRAGRIAPMRSEIDPRRIASALEHTFILEYNNPLDVRFRLAGMKLCELMGMELRGMPASAIIEVAHRDELSRVLNDLVAEPKIVELNLQTARDVPASVTARMLLLPMQDNKNKICRFLGCLTSEGTAVDFPHRFEIRGVKTTRIVGVQESFKNSDTSGFEEEATEFLQNPTDIRKPQRPQQKTGRLIAGKPYLRVVKDD